MNISNSSIALLLSVTIVTLLSAHDGRRFEVKVVNNQLFVQGYISTGIDDQGGTTRPYHNALHDHWNNIPGTTVAAIADLPGYDVFRLADSHVNAAGYSGGGVAEQLAGSSLTLELVGARKWSPPTAAPFGTPDLQPLDPTELITIGNGNGFTDTTNPSILTLANSIDANGSTDLDLDYTIGAEPSGVLYALEWVLSTSAPGIADSPSLYTILAPDPDAMNTGSGSPMIGLHHQALHLERFLGVAVPEPTGRWLLGTLLTGVFLSARRRN